MCVRAHVCVDAHFLKKSFQIVYPTRPSASRISDRIEESEAGTVITRIRPRDYGSPHILLTNYGCAAYIGRRRYCRAVIMPRISIQIPFKKFVTQ